MHLIAHVSYPCAEPLRSGLTLGTLSRPAALPPLVLLSSRASAHCTSIMERCPSLCRIRTNAGVTGEKEMVLGFQNPIEELGQEDVTPSGTLTIEIANKRVLDHTNQPSNISHAVRASRSFWPLRG